MANFGTFCDLRNLNHVEASFVHRVIKYLSNLMTFASEKNILRLIFCRFGVVFFCSLPWLHSYQHNAGYTEELANTCQRRWRFIRKYSWNRQNSPRWWCVLNIQIFFSLNMTDLCYHFIVFTSKFKFSFANFTFHKHLFIMAMGFGRVARLLIIIIQCRMQRYFNVHQTWAWNEQSWRVIFTDILFSHV